MPPFAPRGAVNIFEIEESTSTLQFASAAITVPHSNMSLEDDIHEDRKFWNLGLKNPLSEEPIVSRV